MTPRDEMIVLARQVMGRAYAPYSNFPVGAVLRGRNGKLYAGCNVENAAYPQGTCAEVAAIAVMVADGEQHIVEAVVIAQPEPHPVPRACKAARVEGWRGASLRPSFETLRAFALRSSG